MVRLHTSLLAVTLATGSALAFSNEYQRRSELDVNNQVQSREFEQGPPRHLRFGYALGRNNLQSRGFVDEEDLFVRDLDAFDLEARERSKFRSAGRAVEFANKLSKSKHAENFATGLDYGHQIASTLQSRGLEDNEDLFGRDFDAFDLEAREPSKFRSAARAIEFANKHSKSKHAENFATGLDYGHQIASTLQSRSLEDNEDLFGRDLDAEELLGREYDLLDERDTIDDLD